MVEADDRPAYSFEVGPPLEASRFLANKGWRPAFGFLDVEAEEHAAAFTVAKATSLDVLRDIREEVQAALDQGQTFETFKRDLRPRLQARGWWGRSVMTDPATGEEREVTLGTPRRLRTIYDANLRSARAAGQWERIQRTKRAMPYLAYRLGPSERHRPHHAAKEWLVLPVDDPFWSSWYPPNGWGCKCWVMQITRARAEALGIDESPAVDTREWINQRTGEARQVPVGIDPGWERNPGQMRMRNVQDAFTTKLAAMSDDDRRTAIRDVAKSWAMRSKETDALRLPIAWIAPDIAERLGVAQRVLLRPAVARHLFAEKGDRPLGDLQALEGLPDATRVARRTDQFGRTSIHILIDQAENPAAPDRYVRNPLAVVLNLEGSDLVLATMYRNRLAKWRRRVEREGMEMLE